MDHEENLYMITLYDLSCHPIEDGVIWFFTNDIEDFQKRWMALETDENRIERFLRSKAGELVTDYHKTDNDEEINIVQSDKATIYDEKFFSLENIYFKITSATGIKTCLHADKINLHFKWLRFKKNFMRIANVEAFGLTEYYNHKNKNNFIAAECWSNPIMERVGEKNFDGELSETSDFFAENSFKSICYLTNRFFKNEKELLRDTKKFIVTKRELDVLFDNFTGC